MPHVNNMEQLLKKLAGCWHESAAGGDVARLELYQAITAKGLSGDDEESTSRAFERQRGAILRVLVRDCQSSCDDIQKSALELLGHIVAMASSCEGPACQPSQASSLWMAVARVLDGEDSKRMVKVMALFAIAKNTMAPDLVAPSVAQLAPAVAQTMRMESTVARQQSAMAIHSLLGSVPGAMARCDPGRADRPEEEDSFWVRCLLRLCFDDAVKVRADALKAAERAVSLGGLRGNAGIAAWVLEALRDGRLSQGMSRVLFYDASSQSQATVPGAAGEADPLPHALGSSSTAAAPDRTNPRQATPQRVKHAIRVWAVHLSLADPTRLLRAKDSAGKKRLLDVGTGLFTWLSGKSADGRDDVKVQAVESWEMFAVSMMAQIGREEAKKVAHMFLRALSRWVLKEKGVVREVAMSSLMRVVASFPSTSLKPLWTTTWKGDKKSKGLGEVLRDVAGGSSGEIAWHHSARILAALLPCFCLPPAEPHPLLRDAGLNLGEELPLLLSILETLMEAFPSPIPEDAASAVDAAAPLLLPPSSSSSRGAEEENCCADVRLEVLPTSGLIANAWCGLAFWAMEQAAAAGLDVQGTGKGKSGPADAGESASDNQDGSGKGHGNTAAAARDCRKEGSGPSSSSAAPPKENEASEAGRPLQVLLEWLLGVRARPSTGTGAKVTTVTEKAVPGGSTAEGRGKAAANPASSPTTDRLARWKVALLAALIRGLSRRLDVQNAETEAGADDADAKLPERAWLDAPVDSSSVFDGWSCAGDCPACAECLPAGGVIRQSISRKWLKSETPLWLVLLTGVLRGRCGLEYRCLDGSGGGGSGGESRVVREACHKGNPRHEPGVATDGTRGGGGSACQFSPVFLSQSFLGGALSLSPGGWPAQLLASLLTGVRSAKGRTQEEEDLALVVAGRVWRAEAARNLAEWNRCLPLSTDSYVGAAGAGFDGGAQGVTLGGDRYRGGPVAPHARTVGISVSGADVQQKQQQRQPSENLRTATANTLRFLLHAACSLFSRPPERNTRSQSKESEGAAGQACDPGNRTVVSTGVQNEAREAVGVAEHDGNLRGEDSRGWSQGGKRSAAVESVFGAETARLWLGLFEARRNSPAQPKGFSKLVKALAKDCGNCAFVVSGGPLGGGKGGAGEEGSSAAPPPAVWGLDFSQTQPPSQQQQQQPRTGQREPGDFASSTQGDKTAGAAATRYDKCSNTDHPEGKKQNGGGDTLAPPPPFVALPVLAAAALALLTAAPAEADAKAKGRAWKAGSATLAWTLTAAAAAPATTTRSPPASPSTTQRSSAAAAAAVAGVAAGEEGATIPAEVCQCLGAVRSCLTVAVAAAADSAGGGPNRSSSSGTAGFPLDRDSLAPVCRLLAVAVRTSYATAGGAAAAADAGPEPSPGSLIQAAPSSSTAVGIEVVAADPAVRPEIRGLVACALSASRKVAASPGLLTALSPLLEAVLDVSSSSCDADSLQSSLLDVWNATFGKINLKQPPAPAWKAAFSPSLLRRLSDLSQRAEVEMPRGITLPVLDTVAAPPTATTAQGLRGSGLSEGNKGAEGGGIAVEESARGGSEARDYSQPESAAVGDLRAAAAGGGGARGRASSGCAWNGGVAGALPAKGGRRSFMKQASRSPSPSQSHPVATPKKRSPSPTSPDGGGFSGKFIRVVGNGRGSGGNRGTPKRRAAVTTHTSLDGSQSIAPWEDGSQLPDTNPDSGPDLPLEEVLPPPPPRSGVTATTAPQAPSTSTSPATTETTSPGSAASPSKRSMEDTGSETVDPSKTSPPSGTAAPDAGVSPPGSSSSASDRRVRPRIMTSASVGGASGGRDDADGFGHDQGGDDTVMGGGAAASCSSSKVNTAAAAAAAAEKEVATMAAIAKAMPSGGGGRHRHVEVESEMSEMMSSAQAPPSGQQRGRGGGVAVDALLQDVRSLARRVEAARSAMSPEQLEEVGALLQKAVES